jgi:hypothetical protein
VKDLDMESLGVCDDARDEVSLCLCVHNYF